jgi:hypothetical protein
MYDDSPEPSGRLRRAVLQNQLPCRVNTRTGLRSADGDREDMELDLEDIR